MEIGLSSCGKEINEELFRAYREAGITRMEISLRGEDCETFDFEAAVKLSEKYGVLLWSFHLPFSPFEQMDISSTEEELRSASVLRLQKLIRRCGAYRIGHCIVHPSAEPIGIEDRRDRLSASRRSLKELAETAAEAGTIICVEDLPRTCIGRSSYEIRELLKADDRLRVCFDTNHLLGEYIPEFIRNVGTKIVTTHISDYDFWNERHWLPGEGKIDWQELYRELCAVGYQGPWLYELGFSAPKSVKRPGDLTCADFYRNAQEIFEGRPLTVTGETNGEKFWN